MHPSRRDAGDIVLGWLTKVIVVLAVLGVVGFDAISVGVARVGATDDASSAAQAASESWQRFHDAQTAYQAAAQYAESHNEKVLTRGFTVDPDGTVHLRLQRTATTLVLGHIGPLKKLATITVSGSGLSVSS